MRAKNDVGLGPYSPVATIMSAIVPGTPNAPTKVAADITSIQIAWLAPSDDGGTPLLKYKVLWNSGGTSTTFTELFKTVSSSIVTYTKGSLSTGETYKFKVIAINHVGDSLPSGEVAIIAATVPLKPAAPTKVSSS